MDTLKIDFGKIVAKVGKKVSAEPVKVARTTPAKARIEPKRGKKNIRATGGKISKKAKAALKKTRRCDPNKKRARHV